MVKVNNLYSEDCFVTMKKMQLKELKVDAVITSPFYNTNKKAGKNGTLNNTKVKEGQYNYVRYDSFVDDMTNLEYNEFTKKLFIEYNKVLKPNGVVLYNVSYGSENTTGMITAINEIITQTPFTLADIITWKKRTAMPNSSSPNKLTRIVEYVFVLVRKTELATFKTNKTVSSVRSNGQKMYNNEYNFIEAPNNDGPCPLNKATYSSELVEKLIDLYITEGSTVYDSFMGSGTTAIGCMNKKVNFIGSELSKKQVEWANERIDNHIKQEVLL